MREGWEIKTLGEIATIYDHLRKPITKSDRKAGLYPYYGASGVQDHVEGYIFDGRYLLVGEDGAKWGPGDKSAYIVEGKCWVNNHAHILQLNGVKDTLVAYLFAFRDLGPYITGAIVPKMTQQALRSIPIPVPPIAEQEKIVAELDCLTGIIEKKKQQLEELDKLAQSIFYDMFGDPITNEKGWEVRLFKEGVVEMFLGPFGSSLKTDCYVEKERSYCMVYEQKHAIKKTLELDNHYIDKEKYKSLQRFEVRSGDLIMSCRGTIGEVYELPSNAPIGIIHPSLMKIRLRDGVFGRTFFKTILDKIVKGEDTNGGCVQMAITAKALGNKLVIHPPLEIQNEFAKKIEAIEKQKDLIKQSIQETETLFNSRMDYWFN